LVTIPDKGGNKKIEPEEEKTDVIVITACSRTESVQFPVWHPEAWSQNFQMHESIQNSNQLLYAESIFDSVGESNEECKTIFSNLSKMDL